LYSPGASTTSAVAPSLVRGFESIVVSVPAVWVVNRSGRRRLHELHEVGEAGDQAVEAVVAGRP